MDSSGGQRVVEIIDRIPNQPDVYQMRDWNRVARDFDAFIFDWDAEGDHLPLIHADYGVPAYVGRPRSGGAHSSSMSAIYNGYLVGIDKTDQDGNNYISETQRFFNPDVGVYTPAGKAWHRDLIPNLMFVEMYDGNRDLEVYGDYPSYREQFESVVEKHYKVASRLGGNDDGRLDFETSGWDWETMEPTKPLRAVREPPAAYAYLAYLAYRELGDPKYLDMMDWAMKYIDGEEKSIHFEWLSSYAPLTAARARAETGRIYDIDKQVQFNLEADPRIGRGWGANTGGWSGDIQPYGLIGNDERSFPSATFMAIGNLVPMVRYDKRYARAVGKWMLHVANSSRLFYPAFLENHQQHEMGRVWAELYDLNHTLLYEHLHHSYRRLKVFPEEQTTIRGRSEGDINGLGYEDATKGGDTDQVLHVEKDGLEHIWRLNVPPATEVQTLSIHAKVEGTGEPFPFVVQIAVGEPVNWGWEQIHTISSDKMQRYQLPNPLQETERETPVYVRVTIPDERFFAELKTEIGEGARYQDLVKKLAVSQEQMKSAPRLVVDNVRIRTNDTNTELFGGGPWRENRLPSGSEVGVTNLAIYHAARVGRLGRVYAGETNVAKIVRWNLNTDFFRPDSYPTYLYYNPYDEPKTINENVGAGPVDIYDAVREEFVARDVQGEAAVTIPPDQAAILVHAPAGGQITYEGHGNYRKKIDGVVVDYMTKMETIYFEDFNGVSREVFGSADDKANLVVPLSTAGYGQIEVAYTRRFESESNEFFRVKWYDGKDWRELERIRVEPNEEVSWRNRYFDLPARASNNDDFRLLFSVDSGETAVLVDQVRVRGVRIDNGQTEYQRCGSGQPHSDIQRNLRSHSRYESTKHPGGFVARRYTVRYVPDCDLQRQPNSGSL